MKRPRLPGCRRRRLRGGSGWQRPQRGCRGVGHGVVFGVRLSGCGCQKAASEPTFLARGTARRLVTNGSVGLLPGNSIEFSLGVRREVLTIPSGKVAECLAGRAAIAEIAVRLFAAEIDPTGRPGSSDLLFRARVTGPDANCCRTRTSPRFIFCPVRTDSPGQLLPHPRPRLLTKRSHRPTLFAPDPVRGGSC